MFHKFPASEFYEISNDNGLNFLKEEQDILSKGKKIHSDALSTYNLVFSPDGMRKIAAYYHEKYGITIDVISCESFDRARNLIRYIKSQRQQITEETLQKNKLVKKGIILHETDIGSTGHSSGLIWEKTLETERLYFFREIWYQDYQDFAKKERIRPPMTYEYVNELITGLPGIELWANGGPRFQLDSSSCTTLALSQIKDCLRLKDSLFNIISDRNKYIEQLYHINFYYLPEELLKGFQIESAVAGSKPDQKHTIQMHRLKDEGKPSGKTQAITLQDFREDYAIKTSTSSKFFGSYTLHKGKRYQKMLQNQWEGERNKTVSQLLKMLAETKNDFEKANACNATASVSPGNQLLDILRDDHANPQQVAEQFKSICSAILFVQSPPEDYKINKSDIVNAQAVEELLIMLLVDKTQPAIHAHFEIFVKNLESSSSDVMLYKYSQKLLETSSNPSHKLVR